MRRRIALLVAGTTSAAVVTFVVPLGLLVRAMAEDRAMLHASQEARNVAIMVSGLHDDPRLAGLVAAVDRRTPEVTSVLTPQGRVLGARDPRMADDATVRRARTGRAFTADGTYGREVLVPVLTSAGTYVVRTAVPATVLHRGVARAWLTITGLGLFLLLLAVGIAEWFGRALTIPLADLADVAHRLREGELRARATPAGPPETVELGRALNRLAARITDLLTAERAAVGDLSHRLRTPVTALRLDAEAVRDPDLAERLQAHVGHLQRTVDAIVKDARRPVLHDLDSSCDAAEVVADRVRFWSALAEDEARPLQLSLPGRPTWVAVDQADLGDIVDVLIDNVFAHTPEGTPFVVGLHAPEPDSPAVLTVRDRGPGLTPREDEERERPGFTGLGLQIVRRTTRSLGGRLDIESEPGRGTSVRVTLPRWLDHLLQETTHQRPSSRSTTLRTLSSGLRGPES